MREIKFRVWDGKDRRMWYGSDIVNVLDLCISLSGNVYEVRHSGVVIGNVNRLGDFVLMQYTGLKDKNGKEIYEGDIVRYSDEDVGLIEWGKYGWFVTHWNEFLGNFPTPFEETLEVIGNIYENPELLEDKKSEEEVSGEEDVADES